MRPSIWVALLSLLGGCGGPGYRDPMAAAAGGGRIDEVRDFLARGAPAAAKAEALITAARAGQLDAIAVLLQAGADPNVRGGVNDWTPVMHAIHKNQRQSVLALLKGGADVNAKNRKGLTALIMAAGYGYADIVRDLLARGASADNAALTAAVGGVPDIDRFTVCSCQTDTVKALLDKAPDLKLKSGLWGHSAVWLARLGNCSEVLRLLERRNIG